MSQALGTALALGTLSPSLRVRLTVLRSARQLRLRSLAPACRSRDRAARESRQVAELHFSNSMPSAPVLQWRQGNECGPTREPHGGLSAGRRDCRFDLSETGVRAFACYPAVVPLFSAGCTYDLRGKIATADPRRRSWRSVSKPSKPGTASVWFRSVAATTACQGAGRRNAITVSGLATKGLLSVPRACQA